MSSHNAPVVFSKTRLQVERWVAFAALLAGAGYLLHMYLQGFAKGTGKLSPTEFVIGLLWGIVYPTYVAAEVLGRLAFRFRMPWVVLHNPVLAILVVWVVRRQFPGALIGGSLVGFFIGLAVCAFLDANPRRRTGTDDSAHSA